MPSAADSLGDFNCGSLQQKRPILDACQIQQHQLLESQLSNMELSKKETSLPILAYKHEILQKISAHPVTIICGETGCGKTTQVPQYIISSDPDAKVIVTQPRRIAAVSVAERVSYEQGTKLGTLVGYHISMDCRVSSHTRISYVTTGILLQKLTNDPKFLSSYSHIIFDEVHERGIQCDFSLIAMKLNLCRNIKTDLKIIVMSATLNSHLFSSFFAQTEKGSFIRSTIEITTRQKPQRRGDRRSDSSEDEVEYTSELRLKQSDKKATCVILPSLRKYSITINYLNDITENATSGGSFPSFDDSKVNLAVKLCSQNLSKGDILIFVPGMREIKMMSNGITSKGLNCKLFELHSQFNNSVSELFAFSEITKIFVSTNIAESSITLPDVKTVIDFCMTKQYQYSEKTNFQRLQLAWASKASMIQRAGRVGRVSDGTVFRLIMKEEYDGFQEYDLPELKRSSLEKTILRIKKLDALAGEEELSMFKDVYEVLANAFEPPEISKIDKTLEKLIFEEALSVNPEFKRHPSGPKYLGADLRISELGKYIVEMPCGIHLAKMLIVAAILGIHDQMIDIVAIMSYKKPFFVAYDKRRNPEDYVHNLIEYDENGFNDFNAKQRIFADWLSRFYFPWKKNNYKRFQVKDKQPPGISEQEDVYYESYKNTLIDGSRLVSSFIAQRVGDIQIQWCTRMCVWSTNFRDILNLRESIYNKVSKNLSINHPNQEYSYEVENILQLVCLFIGFKNNLIEIQLERRNTYSISKEEDQKLDVSLILTDAQFTEQQLYDFLRPLENPNLKITRSYSSYHVSGSLRYLAKLRLPYRSRKSHIPPCVSPVFAHLTNNNPIYEYSFTLREKRHSKQVCVDEESINKAQFYSGSFQGYLLTNQFFESNRGLLAKSTSWISSEQATILLIVLSKSVKFVWNKTQQFFTGMQVDGTKYQLPFYVTNELLKIVQKLRKIIKSIYTVNSKQQPDYQYIISTFLFLLDSCKIIQQLPTLEDWQELFACLAGFEDRGAKLSQEIDDLKHVPDFPDTYYSRYAKWKRDVLKEQQAQLGQYKYNSCIFACKECLPQISIVCTLENVDKTKRVFIQKESTSEWIVRDGQLYCRGPAGHHLGELEDNKPIIDCEKSLVLRYPSGNQKVVSLSSVNFEQVSKQETDERKWVKEKQRQSKQYQCQICYEAGCRHYEDCYDNYRKHCLKHRDKERLFKLHL